MAWRERAIEVVLGGTAGLLVTVAFIVLRHEGVTAGEWLQFAAVFLGVMATIGGTLWLQSHSEEKKRKSQAKNVIDAIDLIENLAKELNDSPLEEPVAHVSAIDTSFQHLSWARDQLEGVSFRVYSGLTAFLEVWNLEREKWLELANAIASQPSPSPKELQDKIRYLMIWVAGAKEMLAAMTQEKKTRRLRSSNSATHG